MDNQLLQKLYTAAEKDIEPRCSVCMHNALYSNDCKGYVPNFKNDWYCQNFNWRGNLILNEKD